MVLAPEPCVAVFSDKETGFFKMLLSRGDRQSYVSDTGVLLTVTTNVDNLSHRK